MPTIETEDDNTSQSSADEVDVETREARAMAAQLENMKIMEKRSSHNPAPSPRGGGPGPISMPSITITSQGNMSQGFPMSPGGPPPQSMAQAMNQAMNQPIPQQPQGTHNRNNSNAQIIMQQQPRLSNSSVHSGSRSTPHYHAQNFQTFQPQQAPAPLQPNMNPNNPNAIYNTTPNSYSLQSGQQRGFFQPRSSSGNVGTGSRMSDPALSMPSLDENKDSEQTNPDTLSQIWKEIKDIKTKLIDEQEKNEELRKENRRLRDAVRTRNRRIKQLSGGKSHKNRNNSTKSYDTIDSINENNQTNNNDFIFGSPTNNGNDINSINPSQSAPLMNGNNTRGARDSRDSIDSIGTDDTLEEDNNTIGDWMIGLGRSLKSKKCVWF